MPMHLRTFAVALSLSLFQHSYAENQTLTLNNPTNPPLTTDQNDGFLDIIAREAFKRSGLTLKLIKLPAERALQNANKGIDDGDLSRIAGLQKHYPNLMQVPVKLYDMDFVAFTNSDKIIVKSSHDLSKFNIGLIRGWKILENKTKNYPHVTSVRNAEYLFEMLDKHRIDIALYSRIMGVHLVKKMEIPQVRVIEPPLASKQMFIFLHKKHEAIIPSITQSLQQIKQEGLYQQIFNEKILSM